MTKGEIRLYRYNKLMEVKTFYNRTFMIQILTEWRKNIERLGDKRGYELAVIINTDHIKIKS